VHRQLMRGFSLGGLRIDPQTGLVSGPGTANQLAPKAMDVLLYLAGKQGMLVSGQELLDKIWGHKQGSTDILNQAFSELRQALNDPPENPKILEEIPGQGYRLLSPVDLQAAPESTIPTSQQQANNATSFAPESTLGQLWREMQDRKVVRTGIGYLVAAWIVLQVAAVISDALQLPAWSMKFITLLLAVGFVVSIIVSWLVQITHGGVVVEKNHDKLFWHEIRHYIELSIIVVLLVVVSLLGYRQIWNGQDILTTDTADLSSTPDKIPIEMPVFEGSVAVLPFVNMGDDPGDTYFGFGLAEELLHKLTRVKSIKVAARTSSFSFGDSELDIPTIAARLKVKNILEGSVRRDENHFRITAQLVNAEGFHRWSETYDLDGSATIGAQSEIALAVAKNISTSLSADALDQLASHPTESPDAYTLYLRGLEYLRRARQPEYLTEAASFFEQALTIDNRYARAHAAACETDLAWFRINRDVQHFENAERACNRALTLDSGLVEVYIALGNLYRTSSQFEKAQELFERAIELSPYVEEAHYGLARTVQGQGNLLEAERLLRYGIELEPGYWAPYFSLGNFLHRYGRYDEAVEYYTRVTELSPDNPDGFTNLGTAYFDMGNWEQAEVAWRQAVELAPTPMGFRNMGTLYYYTGRYAEAAAMHQKAIELAPKDHWLWGKLGAASRYIEGQEDASKAAYQTAIQLANERLAVESDDTTTMAYLAAYHVNVGNREQAEQLYSKAIQGEPTNPELWYFAAVVNSRLGRDARALSDLSRAVDLGYSRRLLATDPQFENLRAMDDFKKLIR